MRRLRPYVAVAVVAVALCADRAVAAAPGLRPEMSELAERIVARLEIIDQLLMFRASQSIDFFYRISKQPGPIVRRST